MAPRGDGKLLFCIFFITCCCTMTLTQVGLPVDCCLAVKNKTINRCFIADYSQQIQGQGCHLAATILVTRRGVKLCVPADEPWVRRVMKHVDRLKEHCMNNNCKGKRCNRLKSA
ncbi:C-C motif chemokine 19-like [Brachionichthys hirsutus]|uniref:C-C motif chemokine 19-like n=1 Tax=Brachionichthys hirsutus TaxID=412623 RepID=UPI003604481B